MMTLNLLYMQSNGDGNLGNMLQMVSTLEGTLTAGPWIDLCLPDGNATIFMKGTRRQTSLSI